MLDVDKARSVVVIKRSMRSGFSGIENELFYAPQTMMLFGDAREGRRGPRARGTSKLPSAVLAAR